MTAVKRIALMATARSVPDLYQADAETLYNFQGGNTGNVAFVNAISSHLSGDVTVVSWNASADELKRAGDIVVIACANQLGSHTDLGKTASNLDGAGLPIVAIGLGAQADSQAKDATITEGTRRWVEVIAAHRSTERPNIGVRGQYTLEQMDKLGLAEQAVVAGCPSNLTNLSFDFVSLVEARVKQKVALVASAIGHPFSPELADIERQILNLVDQTEGTCIVQHGLSMIRLATAEFDKIDAALLETSRRYFRPNLTLDEFRIWCRKRMLAFGDADSWMTWTKRYDFVIGPRFHGVMLAIQAGVPAGCVAHDSRTLELCQTMAIPVRMYDSFKSPLTLDNLSETFQFDAASYRATRASLAKAYVGLYAAAGISYDGRLDKVVANSAGKQHQAA
ncbi:polysaccharide pyruvyl transferase family protein [Microvirga antarctica]|uniref:polysaccharide pyruvyl transferase family protein n=1 Tax=Microvirga antarctica TaxID=2819233 RepID=UPI001B313378|nr:polysaccharide pyruvyl transferase family protein [Microvirga antarctica]